MLHYCWVVPHHVVPILPLFIIMLHTSCCCTISSCCTSLCYIFKLYLTVPIMLHPLVLHLDTLTLHLGTLMLHLDTLVLHTLIHICCTLIYLCWTLTHLCCTHWYTAHNNSCYGAMACSLAHSNKHIPDSVQSLLTQQYLVYRNVNSWMCCNAAIQGLFRILTTVPNSRSKLAQDCS